MTCGKCMNGPTIEIEDDTYQKLQRFKRYPEQCDCEVIKELLDLVG